MILQALAQLADAEQLVPDPDLELKPVSWMVTLKPDGSLVQIESRRINLNEGKNRKAKYVGMPMLVPRQFYRSGTRPAAYFLVDNMKFIFGRDVSKPEFSDVHGVSYRERFRKQVSECHIATGDTSISAVEKFLSRIEQGEAIELPEDAAPGDLFAFQVGLSEPVHLQPAVFAWWKSKSGSSDEAGDRYECLVSGQRFSEVSQFPQVERVPGASKPIKLISFNSKAFESYGLERNENATVSELAGVKVATALNRLLHPEYPRPNDPQSALPPRSIRYGDSATCYWSRSSSPEVTSVLDALPRLFGDDAATASDASHPDDVKNVYQCIWRGQLPPIKDRKAFSDSFYVLILSGAQGRAIVRDWMESTLDVTLGHLAEHFSDLQMVRTARPKAGNPESPAIPLRWLLDSLAAEGKSDAPAPLEAGFLRAAFSGSPYPLQILQRALVRARVETGGDEWADAARRDARAALIRAVLNRRLRFDAQARSRYSEVPVSLSPSFESDGYSLGALMAVLERLQVAALGEVNASIIDRFFSAASASPRSVFVRLLKNSRHHARKAADDGQQGGLARWLDRMIDYFCSRFDVNRRRYPSSAAGIPAHLDLEQQALFVLGYHQMRYWLWMKKEERKRWESDHPDAPAVFRTSGSDEEAVEHAA